MEKVNLTTVVQKPTEDLFGNEIVRVESFTQAGTFYEVDKKKKTCSCPAYSKTKAKMCKHIAMVLGINKDSHSAGASQSLMKSALQKAVRRNMPDKAVRIAKAMMESDPVDTMRRLPIVVIEDCILHPRFHELMLALEKVSKQGLFCIDDEMKDMVVQIVDDIASCEVRSHGFITKEKFEMDKIQISFNQIESDLQEDEQSLVKSVFRRKFLGGMGGDMEMLERVHKQFSELFMKRELSVSTLRSYFKGSRIKYSEVDKLSKSDILLEAVDFHCSPILRILVKKEYVQKVVSDAFPNDVMPLDKRLMDIVWRMRSGVNFKKDFITGQPIDWFDDAADGNVGDREKYEEVYKKISVELDNISRWFIEKNFSV